MISSHSIAPISSLSIARQPFTLAALILAIPALGAAHAGAQEVPPARALGAVVHRSTHVFGPAPRVVPLSDGRVMVGDATKGLLVLGDSSLARWKVALDSTRGGDDSYDSSGLLMAFQGDSAMFFAPGAGALLIIDPQGRVARVVAAPPMGSVSWLMVPYHRLPAISPRLGLIFSVNVLRGVARPRPAPGQPDAVVRTADSSFLLRMDMATRGIDTLAPISRGTGTVRISSATPGPPSSTPMLYPYTDGVAVTADGSIAILHAGQFRLEWINPDGTRTMGARIPFSWRAIADTEKQHIVDSVNAARRAVYGSALAKRAADSARTGSPPMTTMITVTGDGERFERLVPASPPRPPIQATLDDVPDFYPPTSRLPLLADGDNNVWIRERPATPDADGVTWSVVNRSNELIARIVVPIGEPIVGFAPGGFVYTAALDGGESRLVKRLFK